MLNTLLTTDKLSVITDSTATLDVHVSAIDTDNTTPTAQVSIELKQNTAITTATTTDILAVPAANHFLNAKFISIRNKHASTSDNVTVQFNANGTLYELFKCLLLAGEELVCREGIWFHFDANGGVYSGPVAGLVDVQVFTATGAGTWTKPTSFTPKKTEVILWGAGGGGGAGASLATAVVAKGGGGGGGGAFNGRVFQTSDLGTTEAVSVGAGGAAGAKGAGGAAGGNGGIGGNTSFGTVAMLTAYGGGGGKGGDISALATGGVPGGPYPHAIATGTQMSEGGEGGVGTIAVPTTNQNCAEIGGAGGGGSAATPIALSIGASSLMGGGGGGSGGGHTATPTTVAPGAGGASNSYTVGGGGAAGTDGLAAAPGGNGTAGAAGISGRGGAGGGGGGSTTQAGSAGGDGGAGGALGGGGGGGGVGQNAGLGGNGGIGGRGGIYVFSS